MPLSLSPTKASNILQLSHDGVITHANIIPRREEQRAMHGNLWKETKEKVLAILFTLKWQLIL